MSSYHKKKIISLFLLFNISGCISFNDQIQNTLPFKEYLIENNQDIVVKFDSSGNYIDVVFSVSEDVRINHPAARKKAIEKAKRKGREKLSNFLKGEVATGQFLQKLKGKVGSTKGFSELEIEEVAKKVQKNLVDKRFYIESSLKVFQSIYDRSSQKVVVVLVSENAPLKNFIEKMKTLVK